MAKMEKKVLAYGLFIALVGVLIILVTVILDEEYKPLTHDESIVVNLLDHLGIAFVSIGIIGIIVDLNDWRKYFQERIAETIIQKNYLERLDQSELIDLQTSALKVFFKAENIEREESLLNFLHTKIHGFIGSPYREDFDGQLFIDLSDDQTAYVVEESTRYKCRTVGEVIQDKVQWVMTKESDTDSLDDFRITVEIPNNFFQSPEFKTQYPNVSTPKLVLKSKDKDQRLITSEKGLGYSYSLSDYKKIDGLIVETCAKYRVSLNRDIVWIMALPTKGFKATIHYPANLRMDATILGVDQRDYHENLKRGLYSLSYDSWMLPTTGSLFHLSPPDKGATDVTSLNKT